MPVRTPAWYGKSNQYRALGIGAFVVKDTFTDTNGVDLDDHTPDIGGSWSLPALTIFEIQGNKMVPNEPGGDARCQIDLGISDFDLSITIRTGANHVGIALWFRQDWPTSGLRVTLTNTDSGTPDPLIEIYDGDGDSLGSDALSGIPNFSTTYVLRIIAIGTSVKVYVDTVLIFDVICETITGTELYIVDTVGNHFGAEATTYDNLEVRTV